MALALSQVGVRACTLDPHEMGLVAEGAPLDSDLVGLDAEAVWAKFDDHDVVVVPGLHRRTMPSMASSPSAAAAPTSPPSSSPPGSMRSASG